MALLRPDLLYIEDPSGMADVVVVAIDPPADYAFTPLRLSLSVRRVYDARWPMAPSLPSSTWAERP